MPTRKKKSLLEVMFCQENILRICYVIGKFILVWLGITAFLSFLEMNDGY